MLDLQMILRGVFLSIKTEKIKQRNPIGHLKFY